MVNLVSGRLTGYLKTPLLTEFEVLLGCESQFMQFPVPLWLFNIAMENGPFIDGLPIKNGDFPWLC